MKKLLITFFTVLFCLTSSVGWSLEYKDLVKRDGIYYKSFTDVPFTGEITGKKRGSFKSGKMDDSWIAYWWNGQLNFKGDYKNGKRDGSWVSYWEDGQLWKKGNYKNGNREGLWLIYWGRGNKTVSKELTGTYKDGKKISD